MACGRSGCCYGARRPSWCDRTTWSTAARWGRIPAWCSRRRSNEILTLSTETVLHVRVPLRWRVDPGSRVVDTVDCVVIGAGVVGLPVARRMAQRRLETIVLEAAAEIGSGTSSRNSEVIHAGIYYPAGSLKARLCRRGRDLLYDFCNDRGVEYRRCGKLIVAASEHQRIDLERIAAAAGANDVTDVTWLP